MVFDNSNFQPSFRFVLEKREGQIPYRANPLPTWLASALSRNP
jgi:hypothetical protein